MKIDEIKKAIKSLIREEVKKAVAEEVSKMMGKVLVEMVKEIKSNGHNTSRLVKEEIESEEEINTPVLKTNNPKLNSVLAETARHFKPLPRTSEMASGFAAMMEGDFEKIGKGESLNVDAPATKLDFLKQIVGPTIVQEPPSALDGGAGVPDVLKKVFKKDFRAVMKKMDEQKRGISGGGYIDTSKVLMG